MKTMDHNNQAGHGNASLAVAVILGIVSWIKDIDPSLKDVSTLVSVLAGLMAIRYYYYATKKNKQ